MTNGEAEDITTGTKPRNVTEKVFSWRSMGGQGLTCCSSSGWFLLMGLPGFGCWHLHRSQAHVPLQEILKAFVVPEILPEEFWIYVGTVVLTASIQHVMSTWHFIIWCSCCAMMSHYFDHSINPCAKTSPWSVFWYPTAIWALNSRKLPFHLKQEDGCGDFKVGPCI